MTAEYLVLGVLLIVMGSVQTWLRHGPAGRAMRRQQESLAQRRGGAAGSNRAWTAWTAVLGGISVALGVTLLVLGALGR